MDNKVTLCSEMVNEVESVSKALGEMLLDKSKLESQLTNIHAASFEWFVTEYAVGQIVADHKGICGLPLIEKRGEDSCDSAQDVAAYLSKWYCGDLCLSKNGDVVTVDLANTYFSIAEAPSPLMTCSLHYGRVRDHFLWESLEFSARSCALIAAAADMLVPSLISLTREVKMRLKTEEMSRGVLVTTFGTRLSTLLTQWGYDHFTISPEEDYMLITVDMDNGYVAKMKVGLEKADEFTEALRPILDRISSPDEDFSDLSFLKGLPY